MDDACPPTRRPAQWQGGTIDHGGSDMGDGCDVRGVSDVSDGSDVSEFSEFSDGGLTMDK